MVASSSRPPAANHPMAMPAANAVSVQSEVTKMKRQFASSLNGVTEMRLK